MKIWLNYRHFSITFLFLIVSISTSAAEQFGRFSVGAFSSTEKFNSTADGAPENDAQNFLGRMYLRVADIESGHSEFVADLRDNYDMFGTLNMTQQQLDSKNAFQARTIYVGNFPAKNKWNYEVGRFSLMETGGTFTDGLVVQHHFTEASRLGIFGGANPYSEADQLVEYVPHAIDMGIYFSYEPNEPRAVKNFFMNFALVQNQYSSEVDRQYFYENIYYQWGPKSRILTTGYLDFVPTTKLQTGTFNYDQRVNDRQTSHLHLLAVDTITYRRLQNIRSTLPASPYEQGQLYWDFLWGRDNMIQPMVTYGHREVDGLTKNENRLNVIFNDFEDHRLDANFYIGQRSNFVSQDLFAGLGGGFYSAKWEFSGDLQLAQENYSAQVLHPITATANVSYVQNRDLFYVASLEYAQDENVVIWANFLKLTYRFGSKETAPLRDGAPTKGAL